jgi:hypothetical protein
MDFHIMWNPRFWLGDQAHGQHRIEVSKGAPSKLNWEAAHRRMTWFIGIPCLGFEGVKMNDNCQYIIYNMYIYIDVCVCACMHKVQHAFSEYDVGGV